MPVREYVFGHSLINHTSPTPATALPWWLNAFANAAGDSYQFTGQFGFLTGHDNGPPTAQWGFAGISNPWNEEGGRPFGSADFTHITITAANFIQYQGPDVPYYNEPDTTPISATLTVIDRVLAAEPGARIVIYENWPDMAPFVRGWPPSRAEFLDYVAYLRGDFHQWWVEYVDALRAARPNADIEMVEVGPILGELLTDPRFGLNTIPLLDLFEDNSPHGTASLYFLAAVIQYTALYGGPPPETFQIPDFVHPAIAAHYSAILSHVDERVDLVGPSAPIDPGPQQPPDPTPPDLPPTPDDPSEPDDPPAPQPPEPDLPPEPDQPVEPDIPPVPTPPLPPVPQAPSSGGASEAHTVSGTDGDDYLSREDVDATGDGRKLIIGGRGNDVIIDGSGADTIVGGEGTDFISFWNDGGQTDVIIGFMPGEDILDLNAQGVTGMGDLVVTAIWNASAVKLSWGSDSVILAGLWDTATNQSRLDVASLRFAPADSGTSARSSQKTAAPVETHGPDIFPAPEASPPIVPPMPDNGMADSFVFHAAPSDTEDVASVKNASLEDLLHQHEAEVWGLTSLVDHASQSLGQGDGFLMPVLQSGRGLSANEMGFETGYFEAF